MPLSVEIRGLEGSAAADQAMAKGVLDPEQVMVQFVCQTEGGGHDPDLTPDENVRPHHAALHGTIWRIDDPMCPVPPLDYGCRCASRLVAQPGTIGARVLGPDATTEQAPEVGVQKAFTAFLDQRVPQWKTIAQAIAKAPPAERLSKAYLAAKKIGAQHPRDVARMVFEVTKDEIPQPLPVPPAPGVPPPSPTPPVPPVPQPPQLPTPSPGEGPLPKSKQFDQMLLEGQPLRVPTSQPLFSKREAPAAPPAVVAAERQIARRTTERIAVFDSKGNFISDREGLHDRTYFPPQQFLGQFKGATITHNHPSAQKKALGSPDAWGTSLSPEDIASAIAFDAEAIRAVTPAGAVFEAARGPNGWPKKTAFKKALKAAKVTLDAAYLPKIRTGEMTPAEFNARYWHEIWQKVSVQLGFRYRWGVHE